MRILPALTVLCCVGALALAGVPWPASSETEVDLAAMRVQSLRVELRELRGILRERDAHYLEVHEAQESLAQDYASLQAAHASLVDEAAGLRDRTAAFAAERDQVAMLLDRIGELETELAAEREQMESRITSEAERWQLDLASLLAAQEEIAAAAASAAVELAQPAAPKVDALREQVLGPVFQLSGGEAVGSAVLIARIEDEDDPHYLALSCFHVFALQARGAFDVRW